ncbi:Clr5 domain-containing protein [Microdochium nivale]|nr:Clr5 domain-containing protein [Microdochium nivale]
MDDDPDPPAPRRGRPQSNGADELDRYRAEIEELRRCNVPLKDIMYIMSATHNCTASINSYKRKFSKWSCHRYKRKERRAPTSPSTPRLLVSLSRSESQPQSASATSEATSADSEVNHAAIPISEIDTLDRGFRQLDISVQSEELERNPPTLQHIDPRFINGFAGNAASSLVKSEDSWAPLSGLQRAYEARSSDDAEAVRHVGTSTILGFVQTIFFGARDPYRMHGFLAAPCCSEARRRTDFEPFSSILFSGSATYWSTTTACLNDMVPYFRSKIVSQIQWTYGIHLSYGVLNSQDWQIPNSKDGNGPSLVEKSQSAYQRECSLDHRQSSPLRPSEELKFLARPNENRHLARFHTRFRYEYGAIDQFVSLQEINPSRNVCFLSYSPCQRDCPCRTAKLRHLEAWETAMTSLHALAKGTFCMSAEEAIVLVCLARSVQACVPASQAKDSSHLFLSDLENWVAMIKSDAQVTEPEAWAPEALWFHTILWCAWRLDVSGGGHPLDPLVARQAMQDMIIAARLLVRWALQILKMQDEQDRLCPPKPPGQGMQGQTHAKAATEAAKKVPPGKDPPTLQAGIAAFINRAVATSAALGFVIGLILCLVSVFALIVASTPLTPFVVASPEFEESCSTSAGSVTMNGPTLTSRASTPDFDVWRPQISPVILPG